MASTAGEAPSTGLGALQTRANVHALAFLGQLELWLERERDQLALWLPVMLGAGIGGWFALPTKPLWMALIMAGGGLVALGLAVGRSRRAGWALIWGGLALSFGCALVWARAEHIAGPVLTRPQIVQLRGVVKSAELRTARAAWRLTIAPDPDLGLPRLVRLSVPAEAFGAPLPAGSLIAVRARLAPPPTAALPNGYDFRRPAWFSGIGAVGKALDVPSVQLSPADPGLRAHINAQLLARLPEPQVGIAMALATGEEGHIAEADQQAMRQSGLAHLLSVSGLHISAVVGAAFFLTLRLLALSRVLALRLPLLLVAGAAGAGAGLGYTLLTGAQVPTVRSCVAALLVLLAMALGRQALTLRLVAAGALIVLLIWPETLIGPSFQLSFAAIAAIVALHESPRVKGWFARRDEGFVPRMGRMLASLLLTGLVVEAALAPVGLYHFHKAGLYGAIANLVAIPLTTFVIMPAEALALVLDPLGLAAPFWSLNAHAIALLLWIAQKVAAWPGAVTLLPAMPMPAYLIVVAGGLWLLLWRSRARWLGAAPIIAGILWTIGAPAPDLLVTGDGRHLALRDDLGRWTILRPRARDFIRQALAERAGISDDLADLDAAPGAQCSAEACRITLWRGGRYWHILAVRGAAYLARPQLVSACQKSDILISPRRLPLACRARWLTLDANMLARTGGLALMLAPLRIMAAQPARDDHPWARRPLPSDDQ